MNLTPYIVLWSLLGFLVLGLALYRKLIALHEEDDLVHISESEQRLIPHQVAISTKIRKRSTVEAKSSPSPRWFADC